MEKSREQKITSKRSQGARRTWEQMGEESSRPTKRRKLKFRLLEEAWGSKEGSLGRLSMAGENVNCEREPPQLTDTINTTKDPVASGDIRSFGGEDEESKLTKGDIYEGETLIRREGDKEEKVFEEAQASARIPFVHAGLARRRSVPRRGAP